MAVKVIQKSVADVASDLLERVERGAQKREDTLEKVREAAGVVTDISGVRNVLSEALAVLAEVARDLTSLREAEQNVTKSALLMESRLGDMGVKLVSVEDLLVQTQKAPGSAYGRLLAAQMQITIKLVRGMYERQVKLEQAVMALYKKPFVEIDPKDPDRIKLDGLFRDFEAKVGINL